MATTKKPGTNPAPPAKKKPAPPANPPSKKVEERKKGVAGLKTLAEMTDAEIFDAYGYAKMKEAAAKKQADLIKEIMNLRTGGKEGDFEGAAFRIKARSKARAGGLDAEKVRMKLSDEDYESCLKPPTEYMEYRKEVIDAATIEGVMAEAGFDSQGADE